MASSRSKRFQFPVPGSVPGLLELEFSRGPPDGSFHLSYKRGMGRFIYLMGRFIYLISLLDVEAWLSTVATGD